jgi:beta-barrel assembly-enhancing protease
MKRLPLLLMLSLLCTTADADDLRDRLRQLKEKVEKPEQAVGQPAKPETAPAHEPAAANAPEVPSIPPIGNVREADEIKIGRYVAGNLLGAAPLVEDKAVQDYVNRVGRWVAGQSDRANLPWTFGVIASDDVNAFAAPGGYVFVTRGLYSLLRDEAELAGVLAHEIGHVTQKHHLKVMQKSQLIGAGGDLLKKRVGSKDDRIKALIGSGAEIMARGLDKDAEFEADRIGVVLAARAGYDPYGLPSVLDQIAHLSPDSGAVALLFKTHPPPDERLARLGEAMGSRFDSVQNGRTLAARLQSVKK